MSHAHCAKDTAASREVEVEGGQPTHDVMPAAAAKDPRPHATHHAPCAIEALACPCLHGAHMTACSQNAGTGSAAPARPDASDASDAFLAPSGPSKPATQRQSSRAVAPARARWRGDGHKRHEVWPGAGWKEPRALPASAPPGAHGVQVELAEALE